MLNKLIRVLAGLGLFYLVIKFLGDENLVQAWAQLMSVSLTSWLLLIILSAVILLRLGNLFRVSIKVLGIRLPFWTSFHYTSMNSFFNTILPLKGGVWIRGALLNRHFQIPWPHYIFVVFSSQLIQLIMLLSTFICLFFTYSLPDLQYSFPEVNFWNSVFVLIAIGLICSFLISSKLGLSILFKLKKGLVYWLTNKKLLGEYIGYSIIFHCATAFRLFLAYEFSGLSLDLNQIVILYILLSVGLSWAFTPGNIGVKEAAIVFIGLLIGIDADISFTASIIDRVASFLVITILGGISTYICSYREPE